MADEEAGAVRTVASGYTPPALKEGARRRLVMLRRRHDELRMDIVEIAPLHPEKLAHYVVGLTSPGQCDVVYRLMPRLLTPSTYRAFMPMLKASNWDLRQLALDLLMDGLAQAEDLPEVRQAVLDWHAGPDPVGRTWAARNLWVLPDAQRRQLLTRTMLEGRRWDVMGAIDVIRRTREEELLVAARELAGTTTDPDILFHLRRLLVEPAEADAIGPMPVERKPVGPDAAPEAKDEWPGDEFDDLLR